MLGSRSYGRPVARFSDGPDRGTRSRKALWNSACKTILPPRMSLHVTSDDEALESTRCLGNPTTCVIPNGIDIPPLPPTPIEDGVLKILFIGRLDPKKGLENLITALQALSERGSGPWRLQIVGDGDPGYVLGLKRLASECGIGSGVEFSGDLRGQEKYHAFANSDVVAVPSYTENFGNVVAEALAHARPVIASRATPWREVRGQHECGLWVGNDSASLASALEVMIGRDRVEMGLRGRKWMSNAFSWPEQTRRMLRLYKDLVEV